MLILRAALKILSYSAWECAPTLSSTSMCILVFNLPIYSINKFFPKSRVIFSRFQRCCSWNFNPKPHTENLRLCHSWADDLFMQIMRLLNYDSSKQKRQRSKSLVSGSACLARTSKLHGFRIYQWPTSSPPLFNGMESPNLSKIDGVFINVYFTRTNEFIADQLRRIEKKMNQA